MSLPNYLLSRNEIEIEYVGTDEAARFLGVSANALRIMVHREKVRTHRLGRRLRFKVQDLRSLIDSKTAI